MWRKAWLETRWRVALMLLLDAGLTLLLLDGPTTPAVWVRRLGGALPVVCIVNAIMVAGTGLGTRTSYRPLVAIDGSMLYTLSLPVTRRRLVLTRVAVGLAAAAALTTVLMLTYWIGAPAVRTAVPAPAYARFGVAVLAVAFAGFGLSTLLSAWLDQLWQVYGAMTLALGAIFAAPVARIWQPALAGQPLGAREAVGIGAALVVATLAVEAAVRAVERRNF